jgi:hypothetical protein
VPEIQLTILLAPQTLKLLGTAMFKVTSSDPSNDTEPEASPPTEIVLAVVNLSAVSADEPLARGVYPSLSVIAVADNLSAVILPAVILLDLIVVDVI